MIDKELEAMFKCHEYLQNLENDARLRVFKYLIDRYGLVNPNTFQQTSVSETIVPEVIHEEKNEIKTTPKSANAKSTNTTSKKTKSSSNQSYSLISSLNLVSKAKISLKDYFGKYTTKNNFEYNIVILSYLKNELKEPNVGINHIYTCYKTLGLKIPSIKQSLLDTKNRKGWIDTSSTDDLKITVAGENFMDHEITKK